MCKILIYFRIDRIPIVCFQWVAAISIHIQFRIQNVTKGNKEPPGPVKEGLEFHYTVSPDVAHRLRAESILSKIFIAMLIAFS